MERDVAGGRGEAAVIVAAAATLTDLTALVVGGLRQGLCLLYAFSNLRKYAFSNLRKLLYSIASLARVFLFWRNLTQLPLCAS